MAQVSNFWKTGVSAGDSPTNWTEADFARRNRAELTDPTTQGVYKGKLNSLAMAGTALTAISFETGAANVYGYFYENDLAVASVAASFTEIGTMTAPVTATRYDRFVLRANISSSSHADTQPAKSVRLARLVGTEGAGVAPAVTQSGTYWEISLYTMMVTTGGVCTLTDARTYVPQVGTSIIAQDMTAISTVEYFKGRQGGSATEWGGANSGTGNYTPTGIVKTQAGCSYAVYASSGTAKEITVTFPVAFSYVPIVVVTQSYQTSVDVGTHILVRDVTSSSFKILAYNSGWSSGTPGGIIVNWLAVGQ